MAGEMWVRVASRPLAEAACRQVFGEDATLGPQIAAPASLLRLLEPGQWPGPLDQPLKVALDTPVDFDIDHELGRGEVKSLVLRINRMAIYCGKELIGHALRTDALGLNALRTYWTTVEVHRSKLRQAH